MPRPATGAPRWSPRHGCWIARVSMPGKEGRDPFPMPGIPACCSLTPSKPATCECTSCTRARYMAKVTSDRVRAGVAVAPGTGETVSEWFTRWAAARFTKGLRTTHNDKGRFGKWIAPHIGTRSITSIVRRDIEEIVQALDTAVLEGKLAWKTATNVWGVVTKMFKDAARSKVLALRVREDNPAANVEGPDRGADRTGPYLTPRVFEAVMICKRVPTRWKRIFALAVFLYARGGELEVLEWSAVNFDQRYVHIHQAMHAHSGEAKPTKTKRNRKVPIEPALLPLLTEMRAAAKGEGCVITAMPPREDWAERLRKYVAWACEDAGIPLPEDILADDETRRPLSFHDLRHTGITWRALRGDDPLKIQRAAGHDDLRTTQRYINEAETFDRAGFGEVFPPLPTGLAGANLFGRESVYWVARNTQVPIFPGEAERPQRDSKITGERREASPTDARSVEEEAAAAIDDVAKLEPSQTNSQRSEPVPELTIDVLRRKLDAAIVAEAWDAVKAIRQRMNELERAAAGNVVELASKRRN